MNFKFVQIKLITDRKDLLKWLLSLKVVSAKFLLVCVVSNKRALLFHFESSFHSWYNQILTFQIFKSYNVIKWLSMKQENYFTKIIKK